MKIAASMSVVRLAPKHSLNIDNIRVISKNVTPKLIKNDVILIDRLRGQDGKHLTIEEYTDQHFQPIIDQYNAKQRRKDRQIQTGYCEWHRGNGTLSQGKGELAYEAVLQYGTHEDIGGEYYSLSTSAERKAELQEEFEAVYREWVEAIQRDYPHLSILYAVIHFSEVEGTPHLHVCFQPEADCTRGLAKQMLLEGHIMTKLIHAFFNMDTNSVELTYNDGSVLTIDCEEVENHYDVTSGQMADLDWLLYNAPMEYASLVLSGEMENYLKGPALHGIED